MQTYFFNLRISYQDFEALYRGHARSVTVMADNGKTVRLPAIKFIPWLSQIGIAGRFKLTLDSDNKFKQLEKIA
ncbi:DUF2835 domain-containing protein [Motilimonas pumila]|uniref:DUF2835 family protein n=1 Tax=Motilimonas pumila TaxID=2303987 RepID=A0A418YBH3_9GAMM|nr:DUF2835 domain-containing protein [Motilimonas pumila]RJG41857.1 DUF2835 family protein [Motilimonas pumila]